MDIHFFDEPIQSPRDRADVRLLQLGLYLYEDRRRVAVGFALTPFFERPSLEVEVRNGEGELAGQLIVIETMSPNFNLTLHLRDRQPTNDYAVTVRVYYAPPDGERQTVHEVSATLDATQPGEQTVVIEGD